MAPPLLDHRRADDAHISRRLSQEPIIWLGTTRPDGRPHHVPVWFLWDDPFVLIFALPASQKVGHIQNNPAVTLSLDSAKQGADIVTAEGNAELLASDSPDAAGTPAFVAKYTPLLMTTSTFAEWAEMFGQPVRVTVTRILAWTRTPDGLHRRIVAANLPRGNQR